MITKRKPDTPMPTASPNAAGDPPASALADGFVLIAMALVAAAITVGLHLQMGLPLLGAVIVGGSLFAGLAGFHALNRGAAPEEELLSEVDRLQAEIERLKSAAPPPVRAPAPALPIAPVVAAPAPPPLARDPAVLPVGPADPVLPVAPTPPPLKPAVATVAPPRPVQETLDLDDMFNLGTALPEPPPVPQRPAKLKAPPSPAVTAAPEKPTSPREDDVEMIQNLIKKMAAQVNAAELARDAEQVAKPIEPQVADGIAASLDALRSTSAVMRAATPPPLPQAPVAPQPAKASAPDLPAADPRVSELARAIEAGRVDVTLEPILGLGDKSARHYDVAIKVRGELGEDLGSGETAGDLSGRGLLPLFDRARITRTAIIAERMADRGKTGAVFSRTAGESLADGDFATSLHVDFIDRPALARYMVLTFTQADVRGFTRADQDAVAALSQLGFRFAITSVTDLDMNFEAMAQAGFGCVKLDADVFLQGLAIPGGRVPAADVCRHLAGTGFAVIIQNINDEAKLAQVTGCGAALGQGALFGGPRPVKADIVAASGQAAA
jgi:cyclic-di-GMP phosphodiesterase, flagellum assembly factor TipF